jgi:hypothetical protein
VRCACGVHVLLLMLCVCICMSGGTICFIGIECVRVCGPVRVNGILTDDPPSHVSGHVLVWTRNERVSTRPSVWAKHILYMRTHATLTLSHEPCNSYHRGLGTLLAAQKLLVGLNPVPIDPLLGTILGSSPRSALYDITCAFTLAGPAAVSRANTTSMEPR